MSAPSVANNQVISADKLLRPQTRMELIVDIDYLSGKSDVRNAMILDITPEHIVASQTEPQILKSRIGQHVEATIVHIDRVRGMATRWGWSSKILGLSHEYRLNTKENNSELASVIFLTPPSRGTLEKTNIRQAYRLEISLNSGIALELPGKNAKVTPINFSAGGLMIGTPSPPPFSLGEELPFSLFFPAAGDYPDTTLKGVCLVVRLEYEPGESSSKVGLKFMELPTSANRVMERIINYHMLEEQRRRNRFE